jgi:hypothetical protein
MPAVSEQARAAARSAARDLIRLVRALERGGIYLDDLDDGDREALEAVNRALAAVLGARCELSQATLETVGRCRATTQGVRAEILRGVPRPQRVAILEALLRVEVDDADLEVEMMPISAAPIAIPRDRDSGEVLRRKAERMAVSREDTVDALFDRLPEPWRLAIRENAGNALGGEARDLRALVESLRPGEREALAALVGEGGLVPARRLEERFGDSSEDGFDWQVEPPTSVLGRLRARGLVVIGRAAVTANLRSRPRVALVPRDLLRPLGRALAECAPPPPPGVIAAEVVAEAMEGEPATTMDRLQPELAAWSWMLAEHTSEEVGPGPLLHYVSRVWTTYEQAEPGQVPRLRARDIESARRDAVAELDAAWVMHEKLLQRRVVRLVARQPHLYAAVSAALETESWREEDKLLVFHACDVAVRAFDAAMRICDNSLSDVS